MTKTCILVLGMHRSGTSAFTRLLNLAGAASPKSLMEGKPDNERGFWESEAICDVNEAFLARCGSRWDDWRALDLERCPPAVVAEFENRIADTIRVEFGDAETIVIKDPRVSRFVPLYVRTLERMGYRVVFLHALRHPRAVAASLGKRNNMAPMQACLLWMRHQLDAESATRGLQRGFFSYEALVQDWRPSVERFAAALSLPFLGGQDDATLAKMDAFLSRDLQHHATGTPLPGVSDEVSAQIDSVSGLLNQLCSDPSDATILAGLDGARNFIDSLSSWAGEAQYATVAGVEQTLNDQLAQAKAQAHAMDVKVREAKAKAQAMEAQVREAKAQAHAMEVQVREAKAQVQAMEVQLREAEGQSQAALQVAREVTDALRIARKRPHVILGQLLKFRVMRLLSSKSSPLPSRMKYRFARSAGKVDPLRTDLAAQLDQSRRSMLPPISQAMTGALGSAAVNVSPEDLKAAFRAGAERQLGEFLASNERITLPRTDEPKVSIILVLWNQAGLTLNCFRSLAAESSVPFEVIVVDNGSTDQTAELLAKVDNIVHLPQTENLGFLRGVNRGLAAVRGGHVLLLNNDATLRPGCLSAAVEAMSSDADVGAVGGPIILPDGRLQEAGSVIWQDGSCAGYGRGDNPADGQYNFRREVDYCSGAFLLIREGLFQELGGFDTDFIPAYYEETDLCMRIRRAGKKVIFEPRAVIDHFEFASSEKLDHALEMQRTNQRKFVEKHAKQLRDGHMPPSPSNLLFARARDRRERILYIDDRVPIITQGAGLPRCNEILRLMVEDGYFVTYFPSTTPIDTWEDARSAVPNGVEVAMGWGLPLLEKFLEERRGYYQQIFVSRPHNMQALAAVRENRPELFEGIRLTYDAEALFASRDEVKANLFGDKLLLRRAARDRLGELALVTSADQVTAVTQAEADQFAAASGKPARVLGHAVEPMPTEAEFAEREDILFLGRLVEEGSPNVDSLIWYADRVQPLLDEVLVDRQPLTVVGLSTAPSILNLDSDRIRLLGVIDELRPIFDRARVFVAPTRFAAGIPHKVHQAAAYGVPTVTTSLLARQLGWKDGLDLLVADTPEGFAAAVHRLYTDQDLWKGIRSNALKRIADDCSIERFRKALSETLKGDVPAQLTAPSFPPTGRSHKTVRSNA